MFFLFLLQKQNIVQTQPQHKPVEQRLQMDFDGLVLKIFLLLDQ